MHSTSANRRRNRAPTALRRSVPIRTFADWTDPVPGYMEVKDRVGSLYSTYQRAGEFDRFSEDQ